jgi:hypothetical protein
MTNLFKNIDNSADLKTVLLQAQEAGFDLGHVEDVQKKYLENIVRKANVLNLNVSSEKLIKELFKGTYEEFKEEVKTYFGQFGKTDKVKELLREINVSWVRIDYKKNVKEEYQKHITKGFIDLGLGKRDFEMCWFMAYDFTSKNIKLDIHTRNHYEFNKLISLLGYEFEIPYFSEYSAPKVWETEDFKIYKNHTVEIKNQKLVGELKELLKEKYQNKEREYSLMLIKI